MKHLIAFTALLLFVAQTNAVTPAKSSSKSAAAASAAPVTEIPVKDEALTESLAKEIVAELPTSQAQISQATQPAPVKTENLMQTTSGDLTLDDDALEAETQANLIAQQSVTEVDVMPKRKEKNMYISGTVGMLAYPDVNNIEGTYSAAASFGYIWEENIMLELGFGVAQYKMESLNANILNLKDKYDIDQYSVNVAAKYSMAFGRIVPNAGVMLQLTQRNFTQRDPNNIGNNGITIDRGNSQTTDAGLIGGVDFEMNRDFAIGVDFKYMMNVANSSEDIATINSTVQNGTTVTPIEKLQSYTAGVSARMNF
jgi:hypothetical protein